MAWGVPTFGLTPWGQGNLAAVVAPEFPIEPTTTYPTKISHTTAARNRIKAQFRSG